MPRQQRTPTSFPFSLFALDGLGMERMSIGRGRVRGRTEFLSTEDLGVRVEAEENSLVVQGVLLLCPRSLLDLGVGGTDDGLDFGAVDETGDVGVGDLGGRKARVCVR